MHLCTIGRNLKMSERASLWDSFGAGEHCGLNINLPTFYRKPALELMVFKVFSSFQILSIWIWLHEYPAGNREFSLMAIFHLSTFQITPDITCESWSKKWSITFYFKVLSLDSLYYSYLWYGNAYMIPSFNEEFLGSGGSWQSS